MDEIADGDPTPLAKTIDMNFGTMSINDTLHSPSNLTCSRSPLHVRPAFVVRLSVVFSLLSNPSPDLSHALLNDNENRKLRDRVMRILLGSCRTLIARFEDTALIGASLFSSQNNPRSSTFIMPLQAQVKSVLSGDTLILAAVGNPAQERTLSLALVSAPRIKREGDEVSSTVSQHDHLPGTSAICKVITLTATYAHDFE